MVRIEMHSIYDHFPERNPVEGEPFIRMYSDSHISEVDPAYKDTNVAFLLEPKSMIGSAYTFCEQNSGLFRYIFTHDSTLLKLPNARMLNWGAVWIRTDSPKTKGISLCTSPKNWCPLHNARLYLYHVFKDSPLVDTFYGDWNNPNIPNIEARDYLEEYKFSIIIENDLDDWWYTEKILNCFGTKTVPIYVGASKIGELFDADGIIQVSEWSKIPELVEHLDIEAEYAKRKAAIDRNYELSRPYDVPWKERFFNDYEALLSELI